MKEPLSRSERAILVALIALLVAYAWAVTLFKPPAHGNCRVITVDTVQYR